MFHSYVDPREIIGDYCIITEIALYTMQGKTPSYEDTDDKLLMSKHLCLYKYKRHFLAVCDKHFMDK
jgi:hypothetical protein